MSLQTSLSAWVAAFCCWSLLQQGVLGSSSRPPCRKAGNIHALRSDKGKDVLVLFGGKGFDWEISKSRTSKKGSKERLFMRKSVDFLGDTWMLGSLESPKWTAPDLGMKHPGKRWKVESVEVNGDTEIALFGGCNTTKTVGVFNDVWVFRPLSASSGTWRKVVTIDPPAARRGHIVTKNSTHLIIFGGKRRGQKLNAVTFANGECTTDLWALPLWALTAGAPAARWTRGQDFPETCRWGSTGTTLVSPEGREVLALFGGRILNSHAAWHSTAPDAYTYFNDLWLYDFAADSWSLAKPKGALPAKRDHHGADVIANSLFIMGGRQAMSRDPDSDLGLSARCFSRSMQALHARGHSHEMEGRGRTCSLWGRNPARWRNRQRSRRRR
eukprot:TRINITY_DN18267_c0_g1_i1.p1 TRINITY_DN18267_c0_g1~~TRINITY_DN18267_c0_g1_i1.p1  ORF type:complete len:384 (-),score=52.88 TRINITY_DN18267_c0_g1_i1:360-1511(-)